MDQASEVATSTWTAPESEAPDMRSAIVTAAARLLDEGGEEAVTFKAAAQRAGVPQDEPARHFKGKDELLSAVATRELQALAETVVLAATASPTDALKEMAYAYVRWTMRYPARFRLTFGTWSPEDEELLEAADQARAILVETVRAAQAVGTVAPGDPDRVAALLLSLAHGAADLRLGGHLEREGKGHAEPNDLIDDLFALLKIAASTRS